VRKKEYDVTILESLRPEDHADHLLKGRSLVRPIRLFGLRVKYLHLDSRREFLRAVEEYAGRSFALHISAHGDKRRLQTADDLTVDWQQLAEALKASGAPDVLSLSACAVLHGSRLPHALSDQGLTPWLVGSSDPEGVAFDDACVAFTAFYRVLADWRREKRHRPLSTLKSDKIMMRDGLDRMHAASDGQFRYYRWSVSRSQFVYNDVHHSAQRLVERFSEAAA